LVHGQIIEAWVPYLKANCIYVVNDEVASDFFRETVIRMAVPEGVEVHFFEIDDFSSNLERGDDRKRAIVLFANISDAARAYKSGFRFTVLNLGNIYNEDCRKRLSSCVQLNDEEVVSLKELIQSHVRIELQRVPKEHPVNLLALPDLLDEM